MKMNINDFKFEMTGYGLYRVIYTTPVRGDYWSAIISDMLLIDNTKNAEEPTQSAMKWLRRSVKTHGTHYSKTGERID